jgi:uncharacterized protein (TIGR03435 family)
MANLFSLRLNFARITALAVAGITALALLIVLALMTAPHILAQSAAEAPPRFEVASIRPCEAGGGGGRGEGAGTGSGGSSPGRLQVRCGTLDSLIQQAYHIFPNGRPFKGNVTHDSLNRIEGGPAWINSERYNINAVPQGSPSLEMMRGPMMQALLEDRFKLKIHRETREVPAYVLTLAKGGFKLQPREAGSCNLLPGQRVPTSCGNLGMREGILDHYGVGMAEFSQDLRNILNRPVFDKTGIAGLFDFHLKYLPDETTIRSLPGDLVGTPGLVPSNDLGGYPSIFTAVQEQLGLKLDRARGPDDFLVIDHIERPTEN